MVCSFMLSACLEKDDTIHPVCVPHGRMFYPLVHCMSHNPGVINIPGRMISFILNKNFSASGDRLVIREILKVLLMLSLLQKLNIRAELLECNVLWKFLSYVYVQLGHAGQLVTTIMLQLCT